MRLLYVLRYWPTLSETFVAAEISGLRRLGHDVVVAAIGTREDGRGLDPVPGLEVWRPPRGLGRLETERARHRVAARWSEAVAELDGLQRRKDVARACWVAERARGRGFDRVHAHFAGEAAEWARLVARVLGCPWSLTTHATDLFRPRPSLGSLLREAVPAVTVCEHHRRWIEEAHGVRSAVVRCGVDPTRFSPGAGRDRGDGDLLRIVAVARWVPKKGLDTLLDAVDLLNRPTELHLVSDPPTSVARSGVRMGALPPARIPDALRGADVFALPCRVAPDGDRDGVPVALMEAMATGLPVISTPVSGVPELVDEGVGWMVPPDDPVAVAAALDAARDPEERGRRGAAARRRVLEGWTVDHQVRGLLRAWGAS